ncbi:MAG: phosphoadenosine phosphosulfate reductase family protein [Muribaculaceae bacterium]|nr:phosphoadenosine phosphosulfate reductase family protein [Muribaculaceae bacterium]
MPIRTLESNTDVLTAAKKRITNLFNTGIKVYLNFSCGKDSLCMSSLVYDLILNGEINKDQLTVVFIDEEGLYPAMVDAAFRWRKKFLSLGVPFHWFCLPLKQVSVLDQLSRSESWITWEPGKEDVWMREAPSFAIMNHPILEYPGEMNYQTFLDRACIDGINMIGIRTAESVTRIKAVASTTSHDPKPGGNFYPIYDWQDADVWRYIRDHGLEFPNVYMALYQAGVTKRHLRLCNFFAESSIQGLRWVCQTDPVLWDRIQKRCPNAYLVLLYWDSEMFHRRTAKRRELEEDAEAKDYKALCKDILFLNTSKYTIPADTFMSLRTYKNLFIKTYGWATNDHYKLLYEGLLSGDPKKRILRILWTEIMTAALESMQEDAVNNG